MSDTTGTIKIQDAAPTADGRPTIELLGEADAGGCCGGGSCGI